MAARKIQAWGAHGITVHPREDERHIRYQDVHDLEPVVTTEFNIEGYPSERWLQLVEEIKPAQATLVPDDPGQLTSDHGWDTNKHQELLVATVERLKQAGCRVSLFIDPVEEMIAAAATCGTDRIELYTGPYAAQYELNREEAVSSFAVAAEQCRNLGMGVNAGHDLSLQNLNYFLSEVPFVDEVSIGHAIICDAVYMGLENTVKAYLEQIPA
jgi:pyridoxine 5-phosphate synthase